MTAVSTKSFNPNSKFDNEILNEAPSSKKNWDSNSVDNAHSVEENRSRMAWHFLTLGIPLLIESLSIFVEGLVHREKTGLPLRVRFSRADLSNTQIANLMKFNLFNEIAFNTPLNRAQNDKVIELMNQSINALEQVKLSGNEIDIQLQREKLHQFASLLGKNRNPKASRKDFNEENWKIVDLIDFKLLQEHFEHATHLFNSTWFKKSRCNISMLSRFNINYYESAIAESLSLSLAYIEGLDGQTISLPVLDIKTGQYRLVSHKIKETTLGDALPCYILETENNQFPPWFVIRGTQHYTGVSTEGKEFRRGGLESLLADSLDYECISRNVVNKALVRRPIVRQNGRLVQKESLSDIFRVWKEKGVEVNLSGHSLGGTLVNALCVEFYDQIKTAYAFSAAGVSTETANRWKMITEITDESKPTQKPKLINFDYEGDIVPEGGMRLIGLHVAIKSLAQVVSNAIYVCHVRSHLNHDFEVQLVDIKKEHKKWARTFCEMLRIITGRIFFLFLKLLSGEYLPDWWRNRKVYKEYASFHRAIRPNLYG